MSEESWTAFVLGVLIGIPVGVAVGWIFGNVSMGTLRPAEAPQGGEALQPVQRNKEVVRWTDWRGRPRELTVDREVKRLV